MDVSSIDRSRLPRSNEEIVRRRSRIPYGMRNRSHRSRSSRCVSNLSTDLCCKLQVHHPKRSLPCRRLLFPTSIIPRRNDGLQVASAIMELPLLEVRKRSPNLYCDRKSPLGYYPPLGCSSNCMLNPNERLSDPNESTPLG